MNIRIFFSAILLTFSSSYVLAQDSYQPDSALWALVEQFPAQNQVELDRMASQLSQSEEKDLIALAMQLKLSTYGGDEKVRYAIGGLAKYLGGKTSSLRTKVEGAMLKAIDQVPDFENKVFLVKQLQYFGTDLSVEKLGTMILQFCEPIVFTLSEIHSPKSMEVLIDGLNKSSPSCQPVILKAIGSYDHPKALSTIQKYLENSNPDLKKTAENALSKSSSLAAYDWILKHQSGTNDQQDLLINYLDNLGEKGDLATLTKKSKTLLRGQLADQVKTAILGVASQYLGPKAKPFLLKAIKGDNPAYALSATKFVSKNENIPSAPFLKKIKSVDPVAQAGLLQMAVIRKDSKGLNIARSMLQSDDSYTRIAAVRAVSNLGREQSIPDLIEVLNQGTDSKVLNVTTEELGRWITENNLEQIRQSVNGMTPQAKVQVLTLVGERKLNGLSDVVLSLVKDQNKSVRGAAFQALSLVAGPEDFEPMLPLIPVATGPEEASLQKAFSRSILQSEQTDRLIDQLANSLKGNTPFLVGLFKMVGGNTAYQAFSELPESKEEIYNWKDEAALPDLFQIVLKPGNRPEKTTAIGAILKIIPSAEISTDLKVLYLRKLLKETTSTQHKASIIGQLSQGKSYPALMQIAPYLDVKDLKLTAANGVVNLILPSAKNDDGWYGSEVKILLEKAVEILKQPGQEYTLAFAQKYLETIPEGEMFISLFNGKDLSGWKGLVANPIARDTMRSRDLLAKQLEADALMEKNWRIENGTIKYTGDGYDNLCTVRDYKDFELILDWKIDKEADSGIYLRGSPQVQIWDPSLSDDTKVGSGGLFNNQVYPSGPLTIADNPIGDWNTFRITMIDNQVTVYLNGKLVTDNVIMENYWDRTMRLFRKGPIELQAHTTNVWFRDIYIRELPMAADLSNMEREEGFFSLFNGVNLDGWVGNKKDYRVENGEIVIRPSIGTGGGNLFTAQEYENFVLRFEFKLTPGANNGLGIHAPLQGDAAYLGKELQILDNTAQKYANLKPYQYHGSLYGLVAAKKGFLNPVGTWNNQEVRVRNNNIRVTLNGHIIMNASVEKIKFEGQADGREHPGLDKTKGHIGFLGHGDQVHFRNIRLKNLD